MRLIIAGSREFKDGFLFDKKLRELIAKQQWKVTEIVSGGCRGVDRMAEEFAARQGISCHVMKATWGTYGRSAGPIRNQEMAKYAAQDNGALVCFWDGASPGTRSMITEAAALFLPVHVIEIEIVAPRKRPAMRGLPHFGWQPKLGETNKKVVKK